MHHHQSRLLLVLRTRIPPCEECEPEIKANTEEKRLQVCESVYYGSGPHLKRKVIYSSGT